MKPSTLAIKPTIAVAAVLVASAALFGGRSACAAENAASPAASGYRLAPRAFRVAVQNVLPSLVTIESFGGVSSRGGKRSQGISKPGDGPTTGVIVSPDGYIITSTFNFIKKQPVITVVLPDGTQKVAELLGRDETRKICLLKVSGVKDLKVPTWLPRSEVKVGQWAISVGVGFGDEEPAISTGIISATSRIFAKAVQTDANISPANYGGPLVDIEGRVIGICVPLSPMAQTTEAGTEWYDSGIGFAVPLHGAEELIAQLKDGKTVQPGKMGIQPKPAGPQGGVAIAGVAPKSPAAKVGVKAGDQIVTLGGEKILDVAHLRSVLGRYVAGEEVEVVVKRDGKELTLTLKLESGFDQPENPAKPAANPDTEPMPGDKPEEKTPDKPGSEKPNDKSAEPKPNEPKPEAAKPDATKPEDSKPDMAQSEPPKSSDTEKPDSGER